MTKWKIETARDKHLTFLKCDIQLAEIGWKFLKNKEKWNINSHAEIQSRPSSKKTKKVIIHKPFTFKLFSPTKVI